MASVGGRQRILIVRLSAIGDTALTLPLMWYLRERMPDALIGWAVGETASPLLVPYLGEARRSGSFERIVPFLGIDRLHVWPRSERSLAGLLRFARGIAQAGYDVSLDTQCLTKSALVPFLARVPRRVGFARFFMGGREASTLLNTELVPRPSESRHVVAQTLGLCTALGIDVPDGAHLEAMKGSPARMRVDALAAERVRAWWACREPPGRASGRGLGTTSKTIIFGVGAGWPTKVLPVEVVAKLAAEARSRGYECVVLWGPAERRELSRWREAFGESAVLGPETDVKEMVALLSMAGRYAGPDSAALHVAYLLGLPTFSWFGASDPLRCAPVVGRHVHVAKGLPCQPCWKRRCPAPDCVREFRAEDMLPAFRAWLDRPA